MKIFRHPMSALAKVTRKNFNGNFTAKINVQIEYLILTLLMLPLKV